ncbi:MAG: phosphoribosyltransferase [Proteobacteria bacterium]|nr:phosphoribosyltransferase [Pseudomonadota bacterium]
MTESYLNRTQAGRRLAERVATLRLPMPVVMALPRGGVPVALEVARALRAPVDLAMVRKIGAPGQPELAVGAVVDGDRHEVLLDEHLMAATGADRAYIDGQVRQALQEIERRRGIYLRGRRPTPLYGRSVVVVDDGIATGTTVKAVLRALRRMEPAQLVLAVPVAPPEAIAELKTQVDAVVCLQQPECFHAVGAYYDDFTQVGDEEVVRALDEAETWLQPDAGASGAAAAADV